jgi:hypothetical protein
VREEKMKRKSPLQPSLLLILAFSLSVIFPEATALPYCFFDIAHGLVASLYTWKKKNPAVAPTHGIHPYFDFC